jgi:hypothetical protein
MDTDGGQVGDEVDSNIELRHVARQQHQLAVWRALRCCSTSETLPVRECLNVRLKRVVHVDHWPDVPLEHALVRRRVYLVITRQRESPWLT